MTEEIQKILADVEGMIRDEIQYIKTGKHPGQPMRDCRGQWEALLREVQNVLGVQA